MKDGIHPEYATEATCSCGNVVKTRSTKRHMLDVFCMPPVLHWWQKVLDTGDRIDKFQKRFGGFGGKK